MSELDKLIDEMRQHNAEMRQASAEMREYSREAKEQTAELKRELAETDKKLSKQVAAVTKQFGDFGNNFGIYTESFAYPSVQRILKENFDIDDVTARFKRRKGSETIEIDVLGLKNGKANKAVIVEVKSNLKKEDIKQMQQMLEKFPLFFAEYNGYEVKGMIVCVGIKNRELINQVINKGIYLAIINDDEIFELIKPTKHAKNQI